VLSRHDRHLSREAEATLAELLAPKRTARPDTGYGLDAQQTALLQLAMIRELARTPADLEEAVRRWLGSARVAA
jgi:hypothetical protein